MGQLKPAPQATVRVDDNPESPWLGCVSVDAGYYGLVDETRIAWAVEFAGDRANAERIVRNQPVIDQVVAEHGGSARLGVKFDGDQVTIGEYDFYRWNVTVKAVS